MIKSYQKRKGTVEEWGIEHGILNPKQRVSNWKKSLKKAALKQAQM